MALGRHLRELWGNKIGLIAALLLAAIAALWSVQKISLSPPGIKPRVVEMGAASTRALVDSPSSAVLDLSIPTTNLKGMTNRGVLVANVMASAPVKDYIARRAGVRAELLQITGPVTPEFPRPLASSGSKASTKAILESPNSYRISVQANPTVPILDIYAQAPTAKAAEALADGAVEGMEDYMVALARRQGTPDNRRVHLEQLGAAQGGELNPSVKIQLALISFVLVFAAACVTMVALGRVRRGWRLSGIERQRDAADPA